MPALPAPTLSTTAGSEAVTLNWTAVAGATAYRILRNDDSCGAGYTTIATVAAPSLTYTDTGLANGFTEYYTVQAVGASPACESALSTCVSGTPQPCAGSVVLSKATYNCSDTLGISVTDGDLVGAGTQNVAVSSTTESSPETVTLTETPANSGIFVGNIATTAAPAAADGQLSVSHGDTILVRYVDVDFCGTPNVDVDANAAVDCQGPIITNVHVTNVTGNSAIVHWDTNEASNSSVTYAVAPGPPSTTPPPNPALVTSHSYTVTGLSACTSYVYSVASTDGAGNSASNDNGGNYYGFTTGVNVAPTYTYSGPAVVIPDNNVAGASATLNVPDNKPIVDLNVTINSLTHTYVGDLELRLIAPDATEIFLSNNRGGSGDNFTNTVFDDAAAVSITTAVAANAPYSSSWRPEVPLSGLNGDNAQGTWTLKVTDTANLDTGTINVWSLNFTYPAQACGPSIGIASTSRTESCQAGGPGSGNNLVDPGEDLVIPITARANGTAAVTGVTGVLSSLDRRGHGDPFLASFADMAADATSQSAPPHYAVSIDDSLPCGSPINFSVQFTSNEGTWSDTFSMNTGAPVPPVQTTYNSTDVPKTMPDIVTIEFRDERREHGHRGRRRRGPVAHAQLRRRPDHLAPRPERVRPRPSSTVAASSGDNFTNTVFDDSAAASITTGTPPYNGTFRPEMPLANQNGQIANGTWTLRIQDAAGGDTGTLTAWFVRITATGPTQCTTCTPAAPGEAGTDLHWQLPSSKTVIEWGAAANASYYKVYQGTDDDAAEPAQREPSTRA